MMMSRGYILKIDFETEGEILVLFLIFLIVIVVVMTYYLNINY